MKRILFLVGMFLLVGCVSAQIDTASIFLKDLPSTTRIDSNYIGITESPYTTYKVTWKQQQRNLNWNLLTKSTTAYANDYLAITHRNAGKDTTKAIKLSNFWKYFLKDSVETKIGTAETQIYSAINELENNLSAELGLKASVVRANQISDSLEGAYADLLLKASNTRVNSTRDSLYSAIALKASVTQYNQVSDSLETAYAQILLEAHNRHTADSTLTASLTLKVSANDVFSLLQILPDSVKIQSKNIILDGNVIADSLTLRNMLFGDVHAQNLESEGTILVAHGSAKVIITPTGIQSGSNLGYGWVYDNYVTDNWVNQQGYLTEVPTTFINETELNDALSNYVTGENFGALNTRVSGLESYPFSSYVLTNDSRLSDARNASDVYSWAKAATKPSYAYSEITDKPTLFDGTWNSLSGKPTSFTPSSHTHSNADISDGLTKTVDIDDYYGQTHRFIFTNGILTSHEIL